MSADSIDAAASENGVEVVSYGERGIVNTIAEGLKAEGLAVVRAFLKQIKWQGGRELDWIDDVTWAKLIVEVGLSQFGDPDLIVVCKCKTADEMKVVFIEAKVTTYAASAKWGSGSRINRQLTLKYRFAMALSKWRGNSTPILEPEQLHEAYRSSESEAAREKQSIPRRLYKPAVLEILEGAKLVGIRFDSCYLVALTWDRKAFFDAGDFWKSQIAPLFLAVGTKTPIDLGGQLGWLGYNAIEKIEKLAGDRYRRACNSMFAASEPPAEDVEGPQDLPFYPSNKHKEFTKETRGQLEVLTAAMREYFPVPGQVEPQNGSVSVKLRYGASKNKVLIKLLPYSPRNSEHIVLGVSADLRRNEFAGYALGGPVRMGAAANRRPFYAYHLPRNSPDEARAITEAVCETVRELIQPAANAAASEK